MATGLNHPVFNSTGSSIPLNQWTHIAATYDGNEWRIYVNGNLDVPAETEGNAVPRSDSIQRFAIGSAQDSLGVAAGFFQGSMDEVRVWDVARSQSQIRATMNDEVTGAPNLIGRWGLNQGAASLQPTLEPRDRMPTFPSWHRRRGPQAPTSETAPSLSMARRSM